MTRESMTVHFISISPEQYADLNEKLTPEIRFTSVEEFPLPHFWLYAPNGDIVVFTCIPIERCAITRTILNFLGSATGKPQ